MVALAENLKEINTSQDSSLWVDLVVVLDKGYIGYAFQSIFQKDLMGWTGGSSGDDFMIPPLYLHLVQSDIAERALHHFFMRLMTHLTFFRKISGVDLMSYYIRAGQFSVQTIRDTNTTCNVGSWKPKSVTNRKHLRIQKSDSIYIGPTHESLPGRFVDSSGKMVP